MKPNQYWNLERPSLENEQKGLKKFESDTQYWAIRHGK